MNSSIVALIAVLGAFIFAEAKPFEPQTAEEWRNAILSGFYRPVKETSNGVVLRRVARQDPDSNIQYSPTPCRWKLCANLFFN
ncbi:hypothetical protein AAVH_11220 [Aphelenchoides avenae]|nr:hypothetical protein AAVH_11220 [Aphelenchus avenae]